MRRPFRCARRADAVAETPEQWALEPNPVVFCDRPDPEKARAWARTGLPYFTDRNPRARFVKAGGWDE